MKPTNSLDRHLTAVVFVFVLLTPLAIGPAAVHAVDASAFGPRSFEPPKKGTSVSTERFSVPHPDAAGSYRMVIHVDGTVKGASVRLNGAVVASSAQLRAGSMLEKPVELASHNELAVTMRASGPSAGSLSVEILGDLPPVSIEVLSPTAPGGVPLLSAGGGWPLTLRLSFNGDVDGDVELLAPVPGREIPGFEEYGSVLLADPDGCRSYLRYLSFDPCTIEYEDLPFPPPPPSEEEMDETVVNFRPGVRSPGPDELGALPDLPALVLLTDADFARSDQGLGLPTAAPDLRAFNLANLVTSIGYEINDRNRRTSLVVQMIVPYWLFYPNFELDYCIGDPVECSLSDYWIRHRGERVDDPFASQGPLRIHAFLAEQPPIPATYLRSHPDLETLPEGPSEIFDVDRNGIVDLADATAQFALISNAVTIEFVEELPPTVCDPREDLSGGIPTDLDGNGEASPQGAHCGPSTLIGRKPPRQS